MAKEMKTLNGYEVVDDKARKQVEAQGKAIAAKAEKTYTATESLTINEIDVEEQHLINPSGDVIYTEIWNCTGYLPLVFDAGEPITVRCSILGTGSLAFYDKDYSFLKSISGDNAAEYGITPGHPMQTFTVTPPNGAAYIRMSASIGETGTYSRPSDFLVQGKATLDAIETIKNLKKRTEILDTNIQRVSREITQEDIIDGSFINTEGKISQTPSYVCTELIPLGFDKDTPVTLRATVIGNCSIGFYNFNGECLSTISGNNAAEYGITPGAAMQEITVTPPTGAAYVRLSASKDSYTNPGDFAVRGQATANIGTKVEEIKETIGLHHTDFSQAKVLVIGDSISTDYYGNYPKWVTHLIKTGFFSKKTTNNDSIHATGFVARLGGEANDFITRIEAVENPETYDLVILFGGINDFIQGIPFGESGGDKTVYFKPAVDYFFSYLIEHFTQARIAVLSPLRTSKTSPTSEGKHQTDYADYIKTAAKSYCIPVLNLTEESGFCPYNTTFKNRWTLTEYSGGDGVTGDGVHPNEEYERKFLAPMIRGFLEKLM